MIRSGHTFTNISNVDDDVLKFRVKGGSGNLQFASGDALYHGHRTTLKKDINVLANYLPNLGKSGNVSIIPGYATRRGGDVYLSGGDVAVPKLQYMIEHEDSQHGDENQCLKSGNIQLRGGSIFEFDDNNLEKDDLFDTATISSGSEGIGGDIDIAPGRGSEPPLPSSLSSENNELDEEGNVIASPSVKPIKQYSRRRHGRVILRDHLLQERLVVNER